MPLSTCLNSVIKNAGPRYVLPIEIHSSMLDHVEEKMHGSMLDHIEAVPRVTPKRQLKDREIEESISGLGSKKSRLYFMS